MHVKEVLVCMGMITSGTISLFASLYLALHADLCARGTFSLPLDQAFIAHANCLVINEAHVQRSVSRRPLMASLEHNQNVIEIEPPSYELLGEYWHQDGSGSGTNQVRERMMPKSRNVMLAFGPSWSPCHAWPGH